MRLCSTQTGRSWPDMEKLRIESFSPGLIELFQSIKKPQDVEAEMIPPAHARASRDSNPRRRPGCFRVSGNVLYKHAEKYVQKTYPQGLQKQKQDEKTVGMKRENGKI